MARTIKEILDLQKATFISSQELRELYGLEDEYREQAGGEDQDLPWESLPAFYNAHFSPASLESIKMYIYATATAANENLFDWLKEDVSKMVDSERYGRLGWYERVSLLFRWGVDLRVNYTGSPDVTAVDGDFAENTMYPPIDDPDMLEELQVVKYAKAVDSANGVGVVIKIAGGEQGSFTQLPADQLASFTAYMNRVHPGGVPLYIVNEPGERLTLSVNVYYNPLVVRSDGSLVQDGVTVKTAINSYLNSVEFAGEFSIMKLTDSVQLATGIELVGEVVASVTNNEETIQITDRYSPASGYLTLDNSDIVIIYETY